MSLEGSPRGRSEGPFDEPVAGLLEDLEQQAEAMHLAERDAEVADRARAEYAAVALADRFHASVGMQVRLAVVGLGFLEGRVRRVGPEWLGLRGSRGDLGDHSGQDWVVRIAAVRSVRGLSGLAVSEATRPLTARLGIGSVLRELERSRAAVVVHHLDGSSSAGLVRRVGADFLELGRRGEQDGGQGPCELVSLRWTAAIRSN